MEISFWKHHPYSDQNGKLLAQEALDFQTRHNFDFLKLTPAGDWLATSYGLKDCIWENDTLGRRKIIESGIKTVDDLQNIPALDLGSGLLREILAAAQICVESTHVPVYATVFCPISQLIQACGLDFFKSAAIGCPEIVDQAISQITKNTILVLRRFQKIGVKGLYYVTQHMHSAMLSWETYQRFGLPGDTETLCVASTLFDDIIYHIHGEGIYTCLPVGIPNLRVHVGVSLQTVISSDYTVIYGLSTELLKKAGTLEDINEILSGWPDTESITCECVLPLDFPDEKIELWSQYVFEQNRIEIES